MARRLKPQTHLAARIIEARGSLDRDEFAKMLGVAKSTLSNWEQGTIIPPLEKLRAIRHQAGVSYEWLIDGEGEMRPTQEMTVPPPAPAQRHNFNRALMHALIEMYYEEAIEMKSTLTPAELADRVLAMYERSVDDIETMADPNAKVA